MTPFWPEIFGHKTVALFDLWTITHFLSGFGVIKAIEIFEKRGRVIAHPFLFCLLISALWEIAEIYMELGAAGAWVKHWFDGVEYWANRLITDQLAFVAGFWVAQRHGGFALPAKIIATIWFLVHLIFLPHSMWLQDWLSAKL